MSKPIRMLLILVGLLLFAVGLLVGQQIQRSKFDKYLQPTSVTSMQLKLLEANLEIVRKSVPTDDGMQPPTIGYNPTCRCFEGTVTLLRGDLMKKPLEEVRMTLAIEAIRTRTELKKIYPELSDMNAAEPAADFRMRFYQVRDDLTQDLIAEFVGGRLTLR